MTMFSAFLLSAYSQQSWASFFESISGGKVPRGGANVEKPVSEIVISETVAERRGLNTDSLITVPIVSIKPVLLNELRDAERDEMRDRLAFPRAGADF